MSPHFSAPPLSLVLHLWPALQLSPSPPPHSLCFLWLHRKKSCKCAQVNCTGTRCRCPSGMWSVWLRAEEDSALQNRLLCQWLCSWQRSSDQRFFFFSPSEALRKKFVITLESSLAKWSNDAFTISAQKVGLNSLILPFKLQHYIRLVLCSSMTLQFSWIAEKSNISLTDIEKL